MLLLDREKIARIAKLAFERDCQLAVHAIGDVAVDAVIRGYEDAGAASVPDHRHRLEHCELFPEPQADSLSRLKKTGLIASMQPDFVTSWAHADGLYGERFGPNWAITNAFGAIERAGILLAFGSDSMPIGPVYGLRGAINHPHEEFCLSLSDAIQAYTARGAFALSQESRLGQMRERMDADFVILDCSNEDDLLDAEVIATTKAGRIVYQAEHSRDVDSVTRS